MQIEYDCDASVERFQFTRTVKSEVWWVYEITAEPWIPGIKGKILLWGKPMDSKQNRKAGDEIQLICTDIYIIYKSCLNGR